MGAPPAAAETWAGRTVVLPCRSRSPAPESGSTRRGHLGGHLVGSIRERGATNDDLQTITARYGECGIRVELTTHRRRRRGAFVPGQRRFTGMAGRRLRGIGDAHRPCGRRIAAVNEAGASVRDRCVGHPSHAPGTEQRDTRHSGDHLSSGPATPGNLLADVRPLFFFLTQGLSEADASTYACRQVWVARTALAAGAARPTRRSITDLPAPEPGGDLSAELAAARAAERF